MSEVKVGDVVDWADVPDGAMVRTPGYMYVLRQGGRGTIVALPDSGGWGVDDGWWPWQSIGNSDLAEQVAIVARGLTGQETADDLRRLAEVFEVREAFNVWRPDTHAQWCARVERWWPPRPTSIVAQRETAEEARQAAAERLHAAGWRPGMTAEDAARLLAGAGR